MQFQNIACRIQCFRATVGNTSTFLLLVYGIRSGSRYSEDISLVYVSNQPLFEEHFVDSNARLPPVAFLVITRLLGRHGSRTRKEYIPVRHLNATSHAEDEGESVDRLREESSNGTGYR